MCGNLRSTERKGMGWKVGREKDVEEIELLEGRIMMMMIMK